MRAKVVNLSSVLTNHNAARNEWLAMSEQTRPWQENEVVCSGVGAGRFDDGEVVVSGVVWRDDFETSILGALPLPGSLRTSLGSLSNCTIYCIDLLPLCVENVRLRVVPAVYACAPKNNLHRWLFLEWGKRNCRWKTDGCTANEVSAVPMREKDKVT